MPDRVKFTLEYEIKSSPKILYNFISETNGLSQWFADEVKYRDGVYTFVWDDGEERQAKMLSSKDNKSVRFNWLHYEPETFFELEILKDELTSDVGLLITDYATEEDLKDRKMIWDIQIENLISVLGA